MSRTWLLTGGAGFIGSNYADRLLARGEAVVILDNLSRRGADANLGWLRTRHGAGAFELSRRTSETRHRWRGPWPGPTWWSTWPPRSR